MEKVKNMIKKVKKIVKNNTVKSQKSNSNKEVQFIELCASHIIDGLHINFLNAKEGKEDINLIVITMQDKIVAHYELIEAEKGFWPIVKKLDRIIN